MSDEITPALSAEEWGAFQNDDPEVTCGKVWDDGCYVTLGPDGLGVEYGAPDGAAYGMSAERRHAIAALALHGQPFGFTREDVEVLRCAQSVLDTLDGYDDESIGCGSLAARIAALLPPEDAK